MSSPTRDITAGPTPLRAAPAEEETPFPATFAVSLDPSVVTLDDGAVLMGGSPLRLWRLSPRAREVIGRWQRGAGVGPSRAAQRLARRLTAAGALEPHPGPASLTVDDVTVVVPVRDRADELNRLLEAIGALPCIVVDDASRRPDECRSVAERHGARFMGLEENLGPAAARNVGVAAATTPLVAFLDSDCVPSAGWLDPLLGHFDDPLVAAVAPRVQPRTVATRSVLSRYESVRSSLDRGGRGGPVRAKSRIPYVPGAALVIRRALAGGALFDPLLRAGEDVDLVWRLEEAGWSVRYVPESHVAHQGPETASAFLQRRAFYGTSAAPLSRRHPDLMVPLETSLWSAAVWTLAATRRPVLAAGVMATSVLVLARRLGTLVHDPVAVAAHIAGGGTARGVVPSLSGVTRAWSPALALALCSKRTRRAAAIAFLVPALADWISDRPDLDPVRYAALHVADDLAYGTGVWAGCAKERTVRPLLPRLLIRSGLWSTSSLRRALNARPEESATAP